MNKKPKTSPCKSTFDEPNVLFSSVKLHVGLIHQEQSEQSLCARKVEATSFNGNYVDCKSSNSYSPY